MSPRDFTDPLQDGHEHDDLYAVDPSAMPDEQIARRDALNPAAVAGAEVSVSPADAPSAAADSRSVHPEACTTSPTGFHEYNTHLECRYCPHVLAFEVTAHESFWDTYGDDYWRDYDRRERRFQRWLFGAIALICIAALVALAIGAWS